MLNTHSASKRFRRKAICFFGFLALLLAASVAHADGAPKLSKGQTVYVPIYSHIYVGDRENPVYLTATLGIRNTDLKQSITLVKADYYDSKGQLIKSYIEAPIVLNAMSATRYVIKESDKIGGSGANFVVQWTASQPVNPPLMESVMISTRSALGISFTSRGKAIQP